MAQLYATAQEEALHRHAMQQLAVEKGLAPALVKAVWERELAVLAPEARVRDYLLIFTLRKTRETLAAQASLPRAATVEAPAAGELPRRRVALHRLPQRWHRPPAGQTDADRRAA